MNSRMILVFAFAALMAVVGWVAVGPGQPHQSFITRALAPKKTPDQQSIANRSRRVARTPVATSHALPPEPSTIADLSADEVTLKAMQSQLNQLGAESPDAMLAYADTLPAGPLRTVALVQTCETLAASEHDGRLLTQVLDRLDAAEKPSAWLAIAEGCARRDPMEAMAWAQSLPDASARDSCTLRIAEEWAATDPAAAIAWLDQQDGSPVWEETLATIVAAWAVTQPEQAMHWAAQQPADSAAVSLGALVQAVIEEEKSP